MLSLQSVDSSQLCRAFHEAFGDYAMEVRGTTEDQLLTRMRKNCVDFALSPGIYEKDRLVGFTLIGVDRWEDALTAFDAGTGIVPDHRRQGWARRMFDHALPELHRRKVDRFILEVLQQNEPAITAYRRSGFTVRRQLRCYVADTCDLRALKTDNRFEIRTVDRAIFSRLESSADFAPSFENRFAAIDALPGEVQLAGAFVGSSCVGALAFIPSLRWLLTIVVDRQWRRRGVGTALLHHLAAAIPEDVTHLSVLNVDADDRGMQAFVKSLGFRNLVDQYEMERSL